VSAVVDDSMIRNSMIRKKLVRKYTDLEVYKRAYKVALEIHKTTLKFPGNEQYETAKQMRRASKGICANIAEGFGKQSSSSAEFGRFLNIAIGSANEMMVWISFSNDLGYINMQLSEKWHDDYDAIAKMLTNLKAA